MASQVANTVVFVKVDIDENPTLAVEWQVQGIPTMVRIENGEETARLIGYRSESEINQFAQPTQA